MPLYLFTGDAWFRDRAIAKLKEELAGENSTSWSETQIDGDDFDPIRFVEALQTPSLFDDGVLIHVKRVDKIADPQPIVIHLEREMSSGVAVIFEGDKLDKRSKFYKFLKEKAQLEEFKPPSRRDLPTAVNQVMSACGLKLPAQGLRYIVENVEGDLSRIGREAEKFVLYADGKPLSMDDVKGLLFHDREGDLFSSLDAVIERRPNAIQQVQQVLDGGEEPTKIFFVLARQLRSLIRIQSLVADRLTNDEISKRTGDFSWLVAKRRKVVQQIPTDVWIEFLHSLHEEDVRIKHGERQAEEALWALLINWLYGVQPAGSAASFDS